MKAQPNKVTITLKLEEGFLKKIRRVVENEIDISEKKWGVNLNSDDRAGVVTHTFNQLFRKVSEISRTPWNGTDAIVVRIITSKPIGNINLEAKTKLKAPVSLVKLREGWSITSEDLDENVSINDFYDHFMNKIEDWARTAAFYGVGSYN